MSLYDVQPEGRWHPEMALLIAAWRDSTREWRENIGEVSEEAIVWQPYEMGPSIGGLFMHMMACEKFWIEQLLKGEAADEKHPAVICDKEIHQYAGTWPVPPPRPLGWYVALQDEVREVVTGKLVGVEPHETREMRSETFTARWIVAHLVEHDSYHGGQAVMLHELWRRLA